jgi:hypothetical protein
VTADNAIIKLPTPITPSPCLDCPQLVAIHEEEIRLQKQKSAAQDPVRRATGAKT